MVNDINLAHTIVGCIGNVISFGLFISPLPTFFKIIKKKSVEEYSAIPYCATIMNCALWILYGIPFVHPNSTLVITINSIGLFLEICYTTIYFVFANKQQRLQVMKVLAVEIVFFVAVALVTMLVFHTHEKRSMFVGILCVIFGACMYASPLAVLKLVIQTKSVLYMPFCLSFASFLNGLIWLTYALLIFDPYILIANGFGTLLCVIQLSVYAIYYKSTPEETLPQVQMAKKPIEV